MKRKILSCMLIVCLIMTMMPSMAWATVDGTETEVTEVSEPLDISSGVLDIGNGSIVITADGYSQGDVTEAWGENTDHALTITGTVEYGDDPAVATNFVRIKGGDPSITLDNLKIRQNTEEGAADKARPAILLDTEQNATLLLKGTTYLYGGTGAPAIQINKNADLIIQDGQEEGVGVLYAIGSNKKSTGNGNAPGIGGSKVDDYAYEAGGEATVAGNGDGGNTLTFQSGDVHVANIVTYGYNDSCVGSQGFSRVTVDGGNLYFENEMLNKDGTVTKGSSTIDLIRSATLTINGGKVSPAASMTKYGNYWYTGYGYTFTMTGGTLVKKNGGTYKNAAGLNWNITGGNMNQFYTKEEKSGRVHTKLSFSAAAANTLVKVTETVDGTDNQWTAETDSNGFIYTYLHPTTTELTVEVAGNTPEKMEIVDGFGLLEGACTCEEQDGMLTLQAVDEELFPIGEETVTTKLSASYEPGACTSAYHKTYEKFTYAIAGVYEGEQLLEDSDLASLTGDVLSVKANPNGKAYTVRLTASSGNEGKLCVSQPLEILVTSYGAEEKVLNVSLGDIEIEKDVSGGTKYSQDGVEKFVVEEGTPVKLIGKSFGTSAKAGTLITVKGGNPNLIFSGVTMDNGLDSAKNGFRPLVNLWGATDDNKVNGTTATIKLEGKNNLVAGAQAPVIQVNRNAKLTLDGTGELTAKVNGKSAAIGPACDWNTYAIDVATGTASADVRNKGSLHIKNGTYHLGVENTGRGLGFGGDNTAFGDLTVDNGTITIKKNGAEDRGAILMKDHADSGRIQINGGVIDAAYIQHPYAAEDGDTLQINGGQLNLSSNLGITVKTGLKIEDAEIFCTDTNSYISVTKALSMKDATVKVGKNISASSVEVENSDVAFVNMNASGKIAVTDSELSYNAGVISAGEILIDGAKTKITKTGNQLAFSCTGDVTIKDGKLSLESWKDYVIEADGNFRLEGGELTLKGPNWTNIGGIYTGSGSFTQTGGSISTSNVKGKNIDTAQGKELTVEVLAGNTAGLYADTTGRVETKYYITNAAGEPLADTVVKVTVEDREWTTKTDGSGVITTYLDAASKELTGTFVVYETEGEKIYHDVPISDYRAVVGTTCRCEEHVGTYELVLPYKNAMLAEDNYQIKLNYKYTATDTCPLPDDFHIGYRSWKSYQIEKVVQNGKPVKSSLYAKIEGDVLTLYKDANYEDYTVYLSATPKKGNKSETVALQVSTPDTDSLDLADGNIVISEDGYQQDGSALVPWHDEEHRIAISGVVKNSRNITVTGGNPDIYLSNMDVNVGNTNTKILTIQSDTTLHLKGENVFTNGQRGVSLVSVGPDAKLTVKNAKEGSLHLRGGYDANIISGTGHLAVDSGTVHIDGSGTVLKCSNVTVNGGILKVSSIWTFGDGFTTDSLTINGGQFIASAAKKGGTTSKLIMTGGYLKVTGQDSNLLVSDSADITGGNIQGYKDAECNGRVLTTLYFVNEKGITTHAGEEVTITEGERTWTAITNADGTIKTYLDADTTEIKFTQGDETITAPVKKNIALIGGTCTCGVVDAVTWNHNLPSATTVYEDQTNVFNMAETVATVECNMPLHPEQPEITYDLAVNADGEEITAVSPYAVLEGNVLTLKAEHAPYKVTLTAACGDKSAVHTIDVAKGNAGGADVILVTDEDNVKEIAADGGNENGHILTGNAKSAQLTVNADAQTVKLSQDSADNVWTIKSGTGVTDVTVDLFGRTAGKTYVGNDAWSVKNARIEDGTVKYNLFGGNLVINEDGTCTQGAYTFANAKAYEAVGASTAEDRTITNNSGDAVTITVNGEKVVIEAGKDYTVPMAAGAEGEKVDTDKSTASYLIPNGTDTYKLLVVGDGDTAGLTKYSADLQGKITEVWFDPDIEALTVNNLLQHTKITKVSIDSAKTVNIFGHFNGSAVHFGRQVESIVMGQYMGGLKTITVDDDNQNYMVANNALYTKDGKTLLKVARNNEGVFKTLTSCETIEAFALCQCDKLTEITLGINVKTIGRRALEGTNAGSLKVAEGNPYFKSVDGVLFTADGSQLVFYPTGKEDKTYTIPDGVTRVADMAIYNNKHLEELNGPANVMAVSEFGFSDNTALKKLTLQADLTGSHAGMMAGSCNVDTMTVPEGFDFSRNYYNAVGNHGKSPMSWIPAAGITVNTEDFTYDGMPKTGVTVSQTREDVTVEYSKDRENWNSEMLKFTQPGTHTVYFRLTKAADTLTEADKEIAGGNTTQAMLNGKYEFARTVYGSATFTIEGIDVPTAEWFEFTSAREIGDENMAAGAAVILAVGGVPLTAEGYEVQYYGSEGQLLSAVPQTAGTYTVKVNITEELYKAYDLAPIELGTYSITEEGMKVISFVTNGGAAIDTITAEPGAAVTVPAAPERKGYAFLGWYADASLRTKVDALPETMPEENAVYYAKWQRETYTITYDNMKDAAITNPTTYHVESDEIVLETPSIPGYEFMGWTYDDLSEPVDTVTIPKGSTGDRIYTGHWEFAKYTITYKNGVSGEMDFYTLLDSKNTSIPLDVPAARTGYTFAGWSMSVNNVVSIIPVETAEIPQGTLGDIALSGIWLAEEQTLTLDAGEGTFADGNSIYVIKTEYEGSVTLTAPERTGYDFAGWFEDEACTVPFEAETMPLTMTIYAKWTPVTYTITYGGMAGAVNSNPATYIIESAITLKEPVKAGYVFTGWTYAGQAAPVKTVVIPKGSYGNKAYTANWTPVVYTITYGGVAGAVNSNPATYTIESAAITLTAPTKAGYVFTGWTYAGQTAPVKTVVIPKGSMGNKAYTANFMMIPTAPAKVTTALYGYDDIKVTWSAATGATSYQVYMKKGSGAYKLATTTSSLTYKAKNLADGAKYTFKVVAYNGTLAGGEKASSAIYTLKKVTGVKVVKSGSKVKVSWKNIQGETGYQISKMTTKKGTQKKPTTYKTTKGKYKKLAATKGKTYYYKVRAYKQVGKTKIYGPWSAVKKFKRK